MARKSSRARATTTVEPTRPPSAAGSWVLLLSLGLVALIAFIYAPVRLFDFVTLDDPKYVSQNPHVLAGLTWQSVSWAFTSRWASYWIPFTWLSYLVEVQIFGVHAGVQHVTNVLLHAVDALLLFTWLRRATGALGRSALVAALFAVHPLHVESVAWITERKDVLSTCFLLLALLAYTAWVRRPSRARYLAVCLLFLAGLLSKPMLVTLPFMLLLCDVWPLARVPLDIRTRDARVRWWALVWEKWPLVAIAAGASFIAYRMQDLGGATVPNDLFPLALRAANAVVSYVLYLGQTIWPARLYVLYPYPLSIPAWQTAGAIGVMVLVTIVAVRYVASQPYFAMGWFWYVGTLVPVIGFVQVGLQPRADRFTYVPLIGLFIALVWGAATVAARWRVPRPILVAAGVLVTLAFTVVARQQVESWRDAVALWTHAVALTPPADAAQAQFELGTALMGQGRRREAITHFTEAIRAKPDFSGAHGALGIALVQEGRKAEGQAEYEETLRLDPGIPEIQNNLGALLASDGKFAEALPHFQEAVRLKPDFEFAVANLGVTLARLGRRDEAIEALRAALRLNPGNPQAQYVLRHLTQR
jgi:Tfp pilus assembly protein PilF